MDRRRPEEVEVDPLAADQMDKIGEDCPDVLLGETARYGRALPISMHL